MKNALTGSGMTQFGRAMKELDIEIICANTPQAKGRVERVIEVLQDRLVKEMRLRGISNIEAANEYAFEYMTEYNARFAVQPRSSHDAHRPLLPSVDLYQAGATHPIQEPDLAVREGDLPDPDFPSQLCLAQSTGHCV